MNFVGRNDTRQPVRGQKLDDKSLVQVSTQVQLTWDGYLYAMDVETMY